MFLFPTEDYLSNHISIFQFLTVLQEPWLSLWMGEVLRLHLGFFPAALQGLNGLPLHQIVENLKLQL